jgi:hypothetical protein
MAFLKLKPFCKVFDKMAVVVASMSHVGKKPREATIFGFTSVVQIAKWLLHGFSLDVVFLLGVWQGFCRSQWRSTWKSPAKGPLTITNYRQPKDDRTFSLRPKIIVASRETTLT